MQQNATPSPLTPRQERALDLLLAGESITAVAEAIDVDRTTLHRWRREDPHFEASLNQRRKELHEAQETRLSSIAAKALGTVEQAVESGDVKVALNVLKGLGFLSGEAPSIGAEDPRDIELDRRSREDGRRGREEFVVLRHLMSQASSQRLTDRLLKMRDRKSPNSPTAASSREEGDE